MSLELAVPLCRTGNRDLEICEVARGLRNALGQRVVQADGQSADLATLRDRAATKVRQFAYGLASLGWTGSARPWIYEKAYLLLAALAPPPVISVHTIVSFDFAVSQVPGWRTTIFPP